MNILIVTPYFEKVGGVEVATHNLEKILTENGHKVSWLTSEDVNLNYVEKIICRVIGNQYKTCKKMKSVRLNKYDAIICNGEYSLGVNHQNVINVFHGSYLGFKEAQNKLTLLQYLNLSLKSFFQYWSSRNKKVIAVSSFLKGILYKQHIKSEIVILNYVDTDLFLPISNKKEYNCVFISRYDYLGKGFDYLEALASSGVDIHCYSNYKDNSKIKWHAMIPNDQVPIVLSKFKVFISPSRFEACSMAILEAMSCGLPVLISKTGFYLELENEIPEFVVDDFLDVDAVKKKLQLILENYEHYSLRSRDFVLKYASKKSYEKKWLEILNDKI